MVAWQMPCRALLPNGMSKLFKAMIDQGSGLACRPRGRSRRKTSGQPRAVCSGRAAATAGLNPISRAHRHHRKGPSSVSRTSVFPPGLQLLDPTVSAVQNPKLSEL